MHAHSAHPAIVGLRDRGITWSGKQQLEAILTENKAMYLVEEERIQEAVLSAQTRRPVDERHGWTESWMYARDTNELEVWGAAARYWTPNAATQ